MRVAVAGSNIQVAPSFAPEKKYSDLSGFEAPYTCPKTKLRYATTHEFQQLRALTDEQVQARLALRRANFVFK